MKYLLHKIILATLLSVSAATALFAQVSPPSPRTLPGPVAKPAPPSAAYPASPPYYDGHTSEKVIAVD